MIANQVDLFPIVGLRTQALPMLCKGDLAESGV